MELTSLPATSQPGDYIYQLAAPTSIGNEDIGRLFAARTSGLYCSTDSGLTWQPAYSGLRVEEALTTMAVALAPDFEHEPHVFAGLNGAILRSYNGGMNWQPCHLPTPPPAISSLVASPRYAEDGIVFAGTNEDGVLVSNDRGMNWVSWNFGLLDLNILCLAISPDFAADETLYAGAVSGLFRSTNGGRAWKEVSLPVGFDAVLSLALSLKFAQDNTIFVGTENKGLLVSRDRGKSWQTFAETTSDQPVNSILLSPRSSTHWEILILHGGALMITRDGGKTWKPWRAKKLEGRNVTATLAPHGLRAGVLVGFEDGEIIRI